jgi:ribosomal protein L11 methyltransferase
LAESRRWPALTLDARHGQAADLVPDSSDLALEEAVSALLDDFGPIAIEDLATLPLPPGGLWDPTFPPIPDPPHTPLQWRVFFDDLRQRDDAAEALRARFPGLALATLDVPDEDWAARSQRELRAIAAGSYIVAPPWDVPTEVPTGSTLIVIEPSRGFGTGHHASTRLCLRALSALPVRGLRVLDLGTGSGVLALAASLAGASSVTAVDVDPDAIDCARESAALNPGATGITWAVEDFRRADALARTDAPWDVVLANLTGGMLISSAPDIRDLVAAGGRLVTSGFDESEQSAVEAALRMTTRHAVNEASWVGLTLARSER